MNTITRLKDSFSKGLNNLNRNPHYFGIKIFQIGILFLAAAPAISFILLILSSLLGVLKDLIIFLMIDSISVYFSCNLMIFNCLIITFSNKDIQSYDISKIWIGY